MNFPMNEPILRFIYWLLNTPGLGGLALLLIIAALLTIFTLTLIWITRGAKAGEPETYAYPTPALLHHNSQEGAL